MRYINTHSFIHSFILQPLFHTLFFASTSNILLLMLIYASEGIFFKIVKNKYFLNKHCVVISGKHTVASDMGDF